MDEEEVKFDMNKVARGIKRHKFTLVSVLLMSIAIMVGLYGVAGYEERCNAHWVQELKKTGVYDMWLAFNNMTAVDQNAIRFNSWNISDLGRVTFDESTS